jgi:hypothetical protein
VFFKILHGTKGLFKSFLSVMKKKQKKASWGGWGGIHQLHPSSSLKLSTKVDINWATSRFFFIKVGYFADSQICLNLGFLFLLLFFFFCRGE